MQLQCNYRIKSNYKSNLYTPPICNYGCVENITQCVQAISTKKLLCPIMAPPFSSQLILKSYTADFLACLLSCSCPSALLLLVSPHASCFCPAFPSDSSVDYAVMSRVYLPTRPLPKTVLLKRSSGETGTLASATVLKHCNLNAAVDEHGNWQIDTLMFGDGTRVNGKLLKDCWYGSANIFGGAESYYARTKTFINIQSFGARTVAFETRAISPRSKTFPRTCVSPEIRKTRPQMRDERGFVVQEATMNFCSEMRNLNIQRSSHFQGLAPASSA